MNYDRISGAILSQTTLRELIEKKELIINNGNDLKYRDLIQNKVIDETSINLNIGNLLKISNSIQGLDIQGRLDLETDYEKIKPDEQGVVIIKPLDFFLGKTYEKLTIPPYIAGIVGERNTAAGNLGLKIEGFIPPGIVLQNIRFNLLNRGSLPVKLYIEKIPPMKVMFYRLSSPETYGANRDTRVTPRKFFSSGTGIKNKQNEIVSVFHSLNCFSSEIGKPVTVTFQIQNATLSHLKSVTLSPIFSNDYEIVSCSKGWELFDVEQRKKNGLGGISILKNFFNCAKSVISENRISPEESIVGTFDVKFFKPTSMIFNLRVDCITEEGGRPIINQPTQPQILTINEEKPFYKKPLFYIILIILGLALIYFSNRLLFEKIFGFIIKIIELLASFF
jgi:deoxycytidine triphosphate deaminase